MQEHQRQELLQAMGVAVLLPRFAFVGAKASTILAPVALAKNDSASKQTLVSSDATTTTEKPAVEAKDSPPLISLKDIVALNSENQSLTFVLLGQALVFVMAMLHDEFVAYLDFLSYKDQLSASSQAIITFALCGFANLSSIAILMGGIGAMAPTRRPDIARLGLKAVLAATLANLMSAALAGIFLSLA